MQIGCKKCKSVVKNAKQISGFFFREIQTAKADTFLQIRFYEFDLGLVTIFTRYNTIYTIQSGINCSACAVADAKNSYLRFFTKRFCEGRSRNCSKKRSLSTISAVHIPNIQPKYIMVSRMVNSPYKAISCGM